MLAIRLKRTGRKGHAQFRVVVQDSRFHPTSGRVVAYLGSYNPHSKSAQLDKELTGKYLTNGAQPSDRAARLLQAEGVKLPDWVKVSDPKARAIRNPEKLRRNQPKEEVTPEAEPAAETPKADSEAPAASDEPAAEAEAPAEETPAEEASPDAEAAASEDSETPAEQ